MGELTRESDLRRLNGAKLGAIALCKAQIMSIMPLSYPFAWFIHRPWGRVGGLGLVASLAWGCQLPPVEDIPGPLDKITFDLAQLDEDGLYGPPDGKRALDYEFCVPREAPYPDTVVAIDPSLRLYPNSPGRIGCTADQVLAIGNTHQPHAQDILMELANLDFIERIDRVDWE